MVLISNRGKIKKRSSEFFKLFIWFAKKVGFILLIALCLVLIQFGPKGALYCATEVTGKVMDGGFVIRKALLKPVLLLIDRFQSYKALEVENKRLKTELAYYESKYNEALSSITERDALRRLLHFTEMIEEPFVTARLLGVSTSPLTSIAIVGTGTSNGVGVNSVVCDNLGIVGLVIEATKNYARVRLLDDTNSRVPIITEKSKLRGMLVKDGNILKIEYAAAEYTEFIVGETVYTSGDGRIFPDSLKVGHVISVTPARIEVELCTNLKKVDYVYLFKIAEE